MKTQKEVTDFFKDKNISLNTYVSVIEYLNAKGIDDSVYCFITSNKNPKNCSFKDFLEWFESEPKKDIKPKETNQDIITFEGKEYQFIETKDDSCYKCDIKNTTCRFFYCTAYERKDRKCGVFKIKTHEPKEKEHTFIEMPKSIKIILFKKANRLGILFDNNNKTLFYNRLGEDYNVTSYFSSEQEIISCKLIPTLFSEIKQGDIYIECGLNQLNPSCYHIKLQGKEYVKIDGKKDIQVGIDLPDKNQNVLKVVPII